MCVHKPLCIGSWFYGSCATPAITVISLLTLGVLCGYTRFWEDTLVLAWCYRSNHKQKQVNIWTINLNTHIKIKSDNVEEKHIFISVMYVFISLTSWLNLYKRATSSG